MQGGREEGGLQRVKLGPLRGNQMLLPHSCWANQFLVPKLAW